ncbi:MAG: TIM barrel protein [Oscillospiraceae bacterium]|nr:TIM barrel protein [Oscillospiraceae bacterium]
MFQTGLVSVSFRKESPEAIISAVCHAGLDGIEWGGDIHVPPGDIKNAARIGLLTEEAGLKSFAYGSYYRLGQSARPEENFKRTAETALALGAPVIRIWAGVKGSNETAPDSRAAMEQEVSKLAEIADRYKADIALECHPGTLTDDWKSSLDFIHTVNHPRVKLYWQPNQFHDEAYNRMAACELAPYTINLHVFHWDAQRRYPLSDGCAAWNTYLKPFQSQQNRYGLLLEFMHDDRMESLADTAATLKSWI